MSNVNRNKGFTLIEVLAAAVISTVAIVACQGAISAIAHNESLGEQHVEMFNLAKSEYDEILKTQDLTQSSLSGDFQEYGLSNYSWTASVNATGTTNLSYLQVTVTNQDAPTQTTSLIGLVFIPPAQGSGTTGAAGATVTPGRTQ